MFSHNSVSPASSPSLSALRMTVPVPVRLTMTLARPPKALISSERNGVWQVASPASTATISPGPETLNLSLSDAVGTIFPSLSATFTSTKTMSSDEYVRECAGAQSPPNSVEASAAIFTSHQDLRRASACGDGALDGLPVRSLADNPHGARLIDHVVPEEAILVGSLGLSAVGLPVDEEFRLGAVRVGLHRSDLPLASRPVPVRHQVQDGF